MPPVLSKKETEQWRDGTCHRLHHKLGAHQSEHGIRFAVWAPHAHCVRVAGDFNNWDGSQNPMQKDTETGIWHTVVPEAEQWSLYKYEIQPSAEAASFLKTDPFAFYTELRPRTASVVYHLDGFSWEDDSWMQQRKSMRPLHQPMAVYEVHLGSWKRKGQQNSDFLTYRELADALVPYVLEMGFTHIELMPVAEHPFDPSWGYQITGYFAPTSRYGEPKDFMYFVNKCHMAGIGVIIDWVPGHFPKNEEGLHMFDSSALYEHHNPLRREQKDWGTHIFDYEKAGVRNFLLSNAAYWCEQFHIDGLRVDAVASMLYLDYSKKEDEWIPNKFGGKEHLEAIVFLQEFNRMVNRHFPGVCTIAEESTAWPGVTKPPREGGLGFDFKWNMGWMNDTLSYMQMPAEKRCDHPEHITFPVMYATQENYVLPLSHDEVVHLKKPLIYKSPGSYPEQFANLRLLYTYMFGHPGKKLLFMGGEFAQLSEWAEHRPLDWHLAEHEAHKGVQRLLTDLLKLYQTEAALYRQDLPHGCFEWVEQGEDYEGFFAFFRKAEETDPLLLFLLNFSAGTVTDFCCPPLKGAFYDTLINTDSVYYGGENQGHLCYSDKTKRQTATVPPFSALILRSMK